jgi:hypothetical protein
MQARDCASICPTQYQEKNSFQRRWSWISSREEVLASSIFIHPSKSIPKAQDPYLIENRFLPLDPHPVLGEGFADPSQHFLHHQISTSIDELQDSLLHLLQPDLPILDYSGKLIDNYATLGYEFL